MPFKSKAQMRYMFSRHKRIARRWKKKYGGPRRVRRKARRLRR